MYGRGIVLECNTLHQMLCPLPYLKNIWKYLLACEFLLLQLPYPLYDCLWVVGQNKINNLKYTKIHLNINCALLHCMINCAEGETLTVTVRGGLPFHNANSVKLLLYRAAWCTMGMLLSAQVAHSLILHRHIRMQIEPYIARKILGHTSQ